VIKGGVLDGKTLTPAEITKLADLESREVLLAKLAGALQASLSQAVYLFAAPLSQTARVIDALRAKVEAEGPVAAAAAPAAEAEVTEADEDTAEAPAADASAEAPAAEATADVAEGGDES
jgi:large subunit ribosomal protein L10